MAVCCCVVIIKVYIYMRVMYVRLVGVFVCVVLRCNQVIIIQLITQADKTDNVPRSHHVPHTTYHTDLARQNHTIVGSGHRNQKHGFTRASFSCSLPLPQDPGPGLELASGIWHLALTHFIFQGMHTTVPLGGAERDATRSYELFAASATTRKVRLI